MTGPKSDFLSSRAGQKPAGRTPAGGLSAQGSPFRFLKWTAAFLFLLSLAAMVCAGLIYADILALRARVAPETWKAYLEAEGPPQSGYLAISVFLSLSLAALAAIVYVFAALSDRLCRPT